MNITKTVLRCFGAILILLILTFGIYAIATYESPVKKLDSLWDTAQALTDKADQLAKDDSPQTGQAYLSAARAWQEWTECLFQIAKEHSYSLSRKERQRLEKYKHQLKNPDILEECLIKAEEHDADGTELGKICYDCGRMMLEFSTHPRLSEFQANLMREAGISYMMAAQIGGNADAEAFLKSEGFLKDENE